MSARWYPHLRYHDYASAWDNQLRNVYATQIQRIARGRRGRRIARSRREQRYWRTYRYNLLQFDPTGYAYYTYMRFPIGLQRAIQHYYNRSGTFPAWLLTYHGRPSHRGARY